MHIFFPCSTLLIDGRITSLLLPTAGPTPHASLSTPAPIPEEQALPVPTADASSTSSTPSRQDDDASPAAGSPSTPRSTSGQLMQGSSTSTPSEYPSTAAPSIAPTPTPPILTEPHVQPLAPRSLSNGADAHEKVRRAGVLIPDPASIFSVTTTASAPDLARRGHSLDLSSPISDGGDKHRNHAGAKIRRSLSGLLHFGDSSQTRRRSMPFAFKVRGALVRSGTSPSALSPDSRGELHRSEGSEDGWEDTREDNE
jgi:hypothetical protein